MYFVIVDCENDYLLIINCSYLLWNIFDPLLNICAKI